MDNLKPKTPEQDDRPKKARKTRDASMPAAGPHAKPELTNPHATPGAGTLPDAHDDDMGGVSS